MNLEDLSPEVIEDLETAKPALEKVLGRKLTLQEVANIELDDPEDGEEPLLEGGVLTPEGSTRAAYDEALKAFDE